MSRIKVLALIAAATLGINYQVVHKEPPKAPSCDNHGGLKKPADQPKYTYGIIPVLCEDGTVIDTRQA